MLHEKKCYYRDEDLKKGRKDNLNAQRSLNNRKENHMQPTQGKSITSQKICRDVTVMKFPQILLGDSINPMMILPDCYL